MKPQVWLERIAAAVLVLVLLSLGWIMVVAASPDTLRLPSLQWEVLIVLALLTSSLILVSVVALTQTRR